MKKLMQFIKEIYVEVKDKTTWPTRDDVLNTTIVVSMSIIIISFLLYVVDIISSTAIRFVVVERVNQLKVFINEFTFILFAVVMLVGIIIYNRIKARLPR
ncbi:protein translocase subunit SecE [Spirochaetota bacterium]|nr:protein translocase subunit SecE [Spirochaetota bacterium]